MGRPKIPNDLHLIQILFKIKSIHVIDATTDTTSYREDSYLLQPPTQRTHKQPNHITTATTATSTPTTAKDAIICISHESAFLGSGNSLLIPGEPNVLVNVKVFQDSRIEKYQPII